MILGGNILSLDYLSGVVGPGILKWGTVLGLGIYFLFALIILKQTKVMSQTIDGRYNRAVISFAWMHLIMTVLLIATSVIIL